MNNSTDCDNNNKGYIFANICDILLYLLISVSFPLLSSIVRFSEVTFLGLQDMLDLLFSELFVSATFFYDFYSRYRNCNNQTKSVVLILLWGAVLFFLTTFLTFILIFIISSTLPLNGEDIRNALLAIALFDAYPFFVAIIELIKRIKEDANRKISKAL